jgi:hypothetical protein
MRAYRRHDQHIEPRVDDRAAAGQRVGGRSGGSGDDQPIAAVRVDVAAIDAGAKIEQPAGFAPQQHDVVEGLVLLNAAGGVHQPRLKQRPAVGHAAAFEERRQARV